MRWSERKRMEWIVSCLRVNGSIGRSEHRYGILGFPIDVKRAIAAWRKNQDWEELC